MDMDRFKSCADAELLERTLRDPQAFGSVDPFAEGFLCVGSAKLAIGSKKFAAPIGTSWGTTEPKRLFNGGDPAQTWSRSIGRAGGLVGRLVRPSPERQTAVVHCLTNGSRNADLLRPLGCRRS